MRLKGSRGNAPEATLLFKLSLVAVTGSQKSWPMRFILAQAPQLCLRASPSKPALAISHRILIRRNPPRIPRQTIVGLETRSAHPSSRRRDTPSTSASPPPSLRYPITKRCPTLARLLAAVGQLRAQSVVHEELGGCRCTGEDACADQNHPLPKRKLGYSSISAAHRRQTPFARLPLRTAVR